MPRGLRPCRSGGASPSTAWRPLACPSGEAAFGPCSPPLAAARSSSGRDPAARLAAGSLAVLLPRMRRSVGASVSRRRCARWGPAASGAIAASPEGRMEGPPPTSRKPCCRPRVVTGGFCARAGAPALSSGGAGAKSPSGRSPMAPERAGPERPEQRVETPALSEAKGTARLRPPLWPARSHAQAGRRAALDAPPERHGRSPRGKRKGLTQWRESLGHPRDRQEKLHAVDDKARAGRRDDGLSHQPRAGHHSSTTRSPRTTA